MSTLKLALNILAEATTTEISKKEKPNTFEATRKITNAAAMRQELHKKPLKRKQANPL